MNRICFSLALFAFAAIALGQESAEISAPDSATSEVAASETNASETKQSVKPGINDRFLDPNLDIQEWIDRFEVESREVFRARGEIMRHLALKPGDHVADVGAGTGFFTLQMAAAVGASGWAYAIDISPRFVEHLVNLFDQRSVANVTTVICDDDSICLPPNRIDVAFLCDVYHHFEYPAETIGSIRSALKDGGRLIVIDFERIPGVSREWTLGHVRADKQTFIDEIQAVGFELVAERTVAGFKENYYLEFRKH